MALRITCPNCNLTGKVPDAAAGQKVRCTLCENLVLVAKPTPVETDATICFECPICSARLKAPQRARGRDSKCPSCQQAVKVPSASEVKSDTDEFENLPVGVPVDSIDDSISTSPPTKDKSEDYTMRIVNWLTNQAIQGVPFVLSSAKNLADKYLNKKYTNHAHRIDALINWETTKNFTTGVLTNFGGILTAPVTIPASIAASWVIQARMAFAIASICGHTISAPSVKALVFACLIGDDAKRIAKTLGLPLEKGISKSAVDELPEELLVEFEKAAVEKLCHDAGFAVGQKTVGAVLSNKQSWFERVIGGSDDANQCRSTGKFAKELFLRRRPRRGR